MSPDARPILEAKGLVKRFGGFHALDGLSFHVAPGEILGLVCRAYGLSNRQRELVTLVAQGQETRAIAGQMVISRYTVQDHLKSIFDKIGVHSRLELLTRLFAQAAA